MAFQSVIMLITLTHACDLATAGVFTIAYASANLFMIVGSYATRTYQASDASGDFSFSGYLSTRIVTVVAMLVCVIVYLSLISWQLGYPIEKSLAVFLMCLFKAIDAFEDVFFGNYQQHGRLDVAGLLLSIRLALCVVVFVVVILLTASLLIAIAADIVFSMLFLVGALVFVKKGAGLPIGDAVIQFSETKKLLRNCAPIFVATFLQFFIINAPRFAIDATMNDAAQAIYGFIAMPVFIVSLLASFIYNPAVASLSRWWATGEFERFIRRFLRLGLWILAITFVCVALAFFLGVPVLNTLFNNDLSPYLIELCILVTGGGLLAFVALFTVGITIIRRQNSLIWGFGTTTLIVLIVSRYIVSLWGITGASWLYFVSMGILTLWFALVFITKVSRGIKSSDGFTNEAR